LRFRYIRLSTRAFGFLNKLLVGVGGQYDDGGFGQPTPNRPSSLQSAQNWHRDIQNDDIWFQSQSLLNSLGTVCRLGTDVETGITFENCANSFPDYRMVVGDKNPKGSNIEAILREVNVLYGVGTRLESLADEHNIISEGLLRVAESVRNMAALLSMLVATGSA
jgi:hypothetical protein